MPTLILSVIALILNIIWEFSHHFLYIDLSGIPKYPHLLLASVADALIILIIFGIISLKRKNFNWIKGVEKNDYLAVVLFGLIIAVLIEKINLDLGRWAYTDAMPTILGIGITPLVQLAFTGALTLFLTKLILTMSIESYPQTIENKSETIIARPEEFSAIVREIQEDGASRLHVLADFDRTLTTAFVDGREMPSLISILRDENYLTDDYAPQAKELFDYYHPIEIDPTISSEVKKQAMEDWWRKHFELLIRCGLSLDDVKRAVASHRVNLRSGARAFFETLKQKNIPLVIMSSSGLGEEAIQLYLQDAGVMSDNIHIISNAYEWGDDGKAKRVREPIIHGMNKDETIVRDFPETFATVEERKNVILLGDSLGDLGMIDGFDADSVLRVGFLNKEVDKSLGEYQKLFDMVVLNDGDMEAVNEIVDGVK